MKFIHQQIILEKSAIDTVILIIIAQRALELVSVESL